MNKNVNATERAFLKTVLTCLLLFGNFHIFTTIPTLSLCVWLSMQRIFGFPKYLFRVFGVFNYQMQPFNIDDYDGGCFLKQYYSWCILTMRFAYSWNLRIWHSDQWKLYPIWIKKYILNCANFIVNIICFIYFSIGSEQWATVRMLQYRLWHFVCAFDQMSQRRYDPID